MLAFTLEIGTKNMCQHLFQWKAIAFHSARQNDVSTKLSGPPFQCLPFVSNTDSLLGLPQLQWACGNRGVSSSHLSLKSGPPSAKPTCALDRGMHQSSYQPWSLCLLKLLTKVPPKWGISQTEELVEATQYERARQGQDETLALPLYEQY